MIDDSAMPDSTAKGLLGAPARASRIRHRGELLFAPRRLGPGVLVSSKNSIEHFCVRRTRLFIWLMFDSLCVCDFDFVLFLQPDEVGDRVSIPLRIKGGGVSSSPTWMPPQPLHQDSQVLDSCGSLARWITLVHLPNVDKANELLYVFGTRAGDLKDNHCRSCYTDLPTANQSPQSIHPYPLY
ncbi:hypothetical protein AKJ16_DCAP19754 [Drosera capensis]